MANHAKRLTAESRDFLRKLVRRGWSGPSIRAAMEKQGFPSDLGDSLISYYRAHAQTPTGTPRRHEEVHTRAVVLHGADGRRVTLTVNEEGEMVCTKQDSGTGAAQALTTTDKGNGRSGQ